MLGGSGLEADILVSRSRSARVPHTSGGKIESAELCEYVEEAEREGGGEGGCWVMGDIGVCFMARAVLCRNVEAPWRTLVSI
jgi:hypothetical protein